MSDLRSRVRRVAASALAPLVPPLRSFLTRRKRPAVFAERLLYRFPPLVDALFAVARGNSQARYERWVAAYDTIDDSDLAAMRAELAGFGDPPHLSLIVSLPEAGEARRDEVVQSLRPQVYEHWEIEFVRASVAREWNAALRSASGDFAVALDSDVLLRPHTLFLIAGTIAREPDALLVYGDEDQIDDSGRRFRHYFKPDWNEALIRSQNYLGGVVCFRRSQALAVGGCEEERDGDCAWGLFLRLTANAPRGAIHHVPFILAHRRHESAGPPDGEGRRELVARALEERLGRVSERVQVEPVGEASYRARYSLPEKPPVVSVIVPTTCRLDILRPCVDGLLNRTSYPALELLLVVNGIDALTGEQRKFLDELAERPEVRTFHYEERPYSFSRTNNRAAERARGELLCFLNDDTDVIRSDWLSVMVGEVLRDRVGAVGAMLVFPNGRIQHAGVVLGVGHVAGHLYARRPIGIDGYHDRAVVDQDLSAVTAACMVVRRDVFLAVGGFDERLAIAFNDIDLCLRLREAGWRVVWTPGAELQHRESASITRHDTDEREAEWAAERALMHSRWGATLRSDPHYNANLSLDALRLWEPAFPPRVTYPWRSPS